MMPVLQLLFRPLASCALCSLCLIVASASVSADDRQIPRLPLIYQGTVLLTPGDEAQTVTYVFDEWVGAGDSDQLVLAGGSETITIGLMHEPATLIVNSAAGTAAIYPAAPGDLAGCEGRWVAEIAADWTVINAVWVDLAGNEGAWLSLQQEN